MAHSGFVVRSVGGVSARFRVEGAGGAVPVLLLHGAMPGLSPYCGGGHIWGDMPVRLGAYGKVFVPDLPGSGGTDVANGLLNVDTFIDHTISLLQEVVGAPSHLVGHDLGGLVALGVAIRRPELVASASIVASQAAAPTGDGVDNLALASPPPPLWSRKSQFWVYDRLSYAHHHIDDALLNASVEASQGAPHQSVVRNTSHEAKSSLPDSVMRAKSGLFKAAREAGIPVPVQVIAASHDPLVTRDQSLWLLKLIGGKQRRSQFHLINRSGNFPHREQPEEFIQVLTAFQVGLAREAA
jgi:2-hydroxy-6-oxonona-2,4-dienedioate hydrolase